MSLLLTLNRYIADFEQVDTGWTDFHKKIPNIIVTREIQKLF